MRARAGTPDDKSPSRQNLRWYRLSRRRVHANVWSTKVSNALEYAKDGTMFLGCFYHKVRGGESIYARLFGANGILSAH